MPVSISDFTTQSALTLSAILLASSAQAAAPGTPEDIIVTAARQDRTARTEQRSAPNIVSIQSAESIAKYPDVNAAEALSRVPGVALFSTQPAARSSSIRCQLDRSTGSS
jgi:outer membrane receptor for ferrienterochelin and colicin